MANFQENNCALSGGKSALKKILTTWKIIIWQLFSNFVDFQQKIRVVMQKKKSSIQKYQLQGKFIFQQ